MVATLNSLAQGAETVLPGLGEGKLLTGQDTPEAVAAFYHRLGVKNVVVKLGKDGAYYSRKRRPKRVFPGPSPSKSWWTP